MNNDLLTLITDGLAEVRGSVIYYARLETALGCLEDIWNPKPVEIHCARREPPDSEEEISYLPCELPDSEETISFYAPPESRSIEASSKRPPPWYIGMSSTFTKAINKIDRKLQGRILEALTNIAANPTTIRGDTVKPLTRELRGCWRYRLGPYRLIYSPDPSSGDITLLAFESRGSIYED